MPAIAHIGLGLGAKKIVPEMNAGYLVAASEAVEIVFMALWALGIEAPPTEETAGFAPYSHSVISGVVLSILIGGFTWLLTRNRKHTLVIALLVLSHTVMDVIASPMTAFYAMDTGKPLFYKGTIRIGLGLWRYKTLAQLLEYGLLSLGLIIYAITKLQIKKINIITKA